MSALEHVRRVCQDVVDARAALERALALPIDDTDQHAAAEARAEAHRAWRAAETAKRAVAEIDAAQILEALDMAECAAPPKAYAHMTLADVRKAVAMADRGDPIQAIARTLDRSWWSVRGAIDGWRDGTSRVAKAAKRAGRWTPHVDAGDP